MMIDLLTGKVIKDTPEEIVRQEYLKILLNDYGYSKINIKIEYPVKKSPSDLKRSLPVDIVIIENGNAKIFVETKKPEYKEGIQQLKDYMNFDSHVIWGVWTNGSETRYLKKIFNNSTVKYVEINNIPKFGFDNLSEQIQKSDLIKTSNLKVIFKRIRAYLASSEVGTTRDEIIAKQIIYVILCKIYDEKFTPFTGTMEFYATENNDEKTNLRIKKIFEKVKVKYDEVFSEEDIISLSSKSLSYVVSQLQLYSLLEAERNVLSDAFESIVGYSLKGEKGQFFTPKNVVQLLVKIINPNKKQKIIDPACGSGSFLIESMLHVWENISKLNINQLAIQEEQKDYAMKKIFGIEKDDFLAKFCKSYMAVTGDGKSGIKILNSLETENHLLKNDIQKESFDIVLTNPPFGKEIKIEKNLQSQFFSKKVDIAFLERSLELLKPNGILGIILSEVVFHAPTYKKIRDNFFYSNKILCVIDLPHDTFRPFNNAKCITIILRKEKPNLKNEMVKMIKINEIGHTPQGNIKYIYDYNNNVFTNTIADDIPKIINFIEQENYHNEYINEISIESIKQNDILIPRYYFETNINKQNLEYISLKQLINENILESFEGQGSPESHFKGKGEYPYIRVKDIVNLEININELDKIPIFEYNRLQYKKKKIEEKDIVFVRRGSYRIGDVGFVYKKDLDSIYTKEIQFFKIKNEKNKYNITKNNFLALLNSNEVKEQLKNLIFMDTTLPTIYKRWEKIKIPLYKKLKMEKVNNQMELAFSKRKEFWEIINTMENLND